MRRGTGGAVNYLMVVFTSASVTLNFNNRTPYCETSDSIFSATYSIGKMIIIKEGWGGERGGRRGRRKEGGTARREGRWEEGRRKGLSTLRGSRITGGTKLRKM